VTSSPSIGGQLTAKNPGRSRGQTVTDRLAVLLLSALALSALTALSGLLLLLTRLLLAAAALLLARLVLAALLLAGVLLVRIVHNVSYFGFSPVMTTIVTPLGCSRSELNSERTKFLEGAGGYEGESRSRAAEEEEPSGIAAPLLARLSPKHGEVIDLVYFTAIGHGDRGDRRHRRGRRSLARRPLLTALPRRSPPLRLFGARFIPRQACRRGAGWAII
jgi:hypothetical protein